MKSAKIDLPGHMLAVDAPAPLRVGYLIDTLLTGGAERLVLTFAEAVRGRSDMSLTVFVLSDLNTPFLERLRASGTEVVLLPGRNLVDAGRFRRLLRALREKRIEYLHAHLASASTLGAYASRLLGIPFITTIHNVKPSVRRIRPGRRLLQGLAMRLPGVNKIAVGEAVAEAAAGEIGRSGCRVVPNAVSETVVAPPAARARMRAELGLSEDQIALVCVGAIIGQKAHEVLLDAFATIREHAPTCVLLLVGDARDTSRHEALLAQAQRLGLGEDLRFLGMRGDIPEVLAASDIFVSSSHWEGAPVSLLEAMANGLPPVVTDVGENALVLEGTGAILIRPRDPEALARGVIEMIETPGLRARTGDAVRARALGRYGVATWVERLLAIYAETGRRKDWHCPRADVPVPRLQSGRVAR
ncbi:glycosyltransferase [Salipiger mangrovisoli]|uniref:Glycosyltransferase n=1 Tax=Salipiger mangrovisoli TaxID=2865933 RepID=A0ABR9WZD8_9RHOB|nr:glycosyltransferase [Salipiger mangrovisoli]MBE9636660.1 glycosyltransferase [Salipiger mangrovisoli]